mgnify:FL=1|tara:strand:- start:154 stop:561 length:408 start_codon:yes stop_codon:yes gene_type:complete
MENLKILEVKRRLSQNRDKFKYDLLYMCNIFNVDEKNLLKKYDWLSEEMIKYYIEKDKIEKKINDVSYGFEKLKVDFMVKNNIDVRDKVLSLSNGEKILDELYKIGFINNDMFEVIKDEIWRKRKTQRYELGEWK